MVCTTLSVDLRTRLYTQALHVGEGKGEAPTLQETNTASLGALPDRLPLQRRPAILVGVQISAPVWMLTGLGRVDETVIRAKR